MPKLKSLSGDEVITVLSRFGFEVVSQKGSHVKLKICRGRSSDEVDLTAQNTT